MPCDELARAIQRIDHPHAALVEPGQIVNGFFRKPAFAVAQQVLAQHGVDGAIGLGHGIVPDLVFRFDRTRSKACKHSARSLDARFNALENVSVGGRSHESPWDLVYRAGHNMRAPVISSSAQSRRRNHTIGMRVAR